MIERVLAMAGRLHKQSGEGMPRDFYLHPDEWEVLAEECGKARQWPCFTVETAHGDVRCHSSRFQQPGVIVAARG